MTLERVTQLPVLPLRSADSNKGTYGRVLIVAGSRGMSGAAVLCGTAALRSGAGLVRVALPREILPIVAAGSPCCMTIPLPQDDDGILAAEASEALLPLARAHTVTAFGHGLGRSQAIGALLAALLTQTQTPLVLDADGLNALPPHLGLLRFRAAPLILTPHPGEFGRLVNLDTAAVQARRQELAVNFAQEHGVVLVLKGHGSI